METMEKGYGLEEDEERRLLLLVVKELERDVSKCIQAAMERKGE